MGTSPRLRTSSVPDIELSRFSHIPTTWVYRGLHGIHNLSCVDHGSHCIFFLFFLFSSFFLSFFLILLFLFLLLLENRVVRKGCGFPLLPRFYIHISTKTSDKSGYRRSAFSSKKSIHFFKNSLPLLRTYSNCN